MHRTEREMHIRKEQMDSAWNDYQKYSRKTNHSKFIASNKKAIYLFRCKQYFKSVSDYNKMLSCQIGN